MRFIRPPVSESINYNPPGRDFEYADVKSTGEPGIGAKGGGGFGLRNPADVHCSK